MVVSTNILSASTSEREHKIYAFHCFEDSNKADAFKCKVLNIILETKEEIKSSPLNKNYFDNLIKTLPQRNVDTNGLYLMYYNDTNLDKFKNYYKPNRYKSLKKALDWQERIYTSRALDIVGHANFKERFYEEVLKIIWLNLKKSKKSKIRYYFEEKVKRQGLLDYLKS